MTRNFRSVMILCLCAASYAGATQLFVGGTFETGTIAGWTASTNLFSPTTGSCITGYAASSTNSGCVAIAVPVDGAFDAFTSIAMGTANGEIVNSLTQPFTVPGAVSSALLTFDNTVACAGSGCVSDVQLYLGSCAPCLGGTNFLGNVVTAQNPGTVTIPWTSYSWDVTSILQAHPGATLTVELTSIAFFAGSSIGNGFDNVSLTAVVTPEPSTGLLVVAGAVLGAVLRRRNYRRLSERSRQI
jgi:hypothetical protein